MSEIFEEHLGALHHSELFNKADLHEAFRLLRSNAGPSLALISISSREASKTKKAAARGEFSALR